MKKSIFVLIISVLFFSCNKNQSNCKPTYSNVGIQIDSGAILKWKELGGKIILETQVSCFKEGDPNKPIDSLIHINVYIHSVTNDGSLINIWKESNLGKKPHMRHNNYVYICDDHIGVTLFN